MRTSFYSEKELAELGLKSYGRDVKISRKVSIYGASNIVVGNNVRIDDFCILSGHIILGSNIHISAYAALYGSMGIELEDYTGISPRSTIYSAMDDFSGDYLIGPIHDEIQIHVTGGKVTLCRYSQIGANCIVFPDINIAEGSVIGAMSLVNKSTEPWTVNIGIPAKAIKKRRKDLLNKL